MKGSLKYPQAFTLLGFQIVSLVDKGETISIEEIYKHIENRTVWTLLEEKLTNRFICIYDEKLRNEFSDYFESSANAIDSESVYGISNNGYCLLISYLFEGIQAEQKSGWFPSIDGNIN